jgi:hypothetical protein
MLANGAAKGAVFGRIFAVILLRCAMAYFVFCLLSYRDYLRGIQIPSVEGRYKIVWFISVLSLLARSIGWLSLVWLLAPR